METKFSKLHFILGFGIIAVLFFYLGWELSGGKKDLADKSVVTEERVELSLWDQEEADNTVIIDGWIKEFQEQNPNISITRQTYPNEDLRTKFTVSATGGQAAEMVWGPNDVAGQFSVAGIIQSVAKFIDPSVFNTTAIEAVKLKNDIYGVPVTYGNHLVLLHNKSMVPNPPETTEELIELAKANTNESKKQYGFAVFQNEPFWLAPFIGGFGGWPLELSETGDAKITLNTPAMVSALSFFRHLKFTHKVMPRECDYDCAKMLFIEGKSAMTINGDWSIKEFKNKMGESLGIAPLPVVSETGQPATPLIGGRFIFVNARLTPQKQAAVELFLKFLTSEKIQIEVATKLGRIPALTSAAESSAVQELPELQPLILAASHGKPMPPQTEMRAVWDAMRPIQQKVMSGELAPETGAKLMQSAAMEKLAALKK